MSNDVNAPQTLRLTLVRHGETTGQSSIRYYGATDVPLSHLGREQMHRASAALAESRFTAVYSSRLSRSREGAEIVSRGSAVEPLVEFNEVNFGDWEGLTREEIAERDPQNYCRWQENMGLFHYPGGESREEFHARVVNGLRRVLEREQRGHVLIVVHRGVIAGIVTELLGLSLERRLALGIDLGSIHALASHQRPHAWCAEALNLTSHLIMRTTRREE